MDPNLTMDEENQSMKENKSTRSIKSLSVGESSTQAISVFIKEKAGKVGAKASLLAIQII